MPTSHMTDTTTTTTTTTSSSSSTPPAMVPAAYHAPAPALDEHTAFESYRARYRRVFPTYVFYLDVAEPREHVRLANRIATHGARVEPFFSSQCSHLVSPSPSPSQMPQDEMLSNPSNSTPTLSHVDPNRSCSRSCSRSRSHSRPRAHAVPTPRTPNPTSKPPPQHPADLVSQATRMGLRIWTRDKLIRILNELDDGVPEHAPAPAAMATPATATARRITRKTSRQQLLESGVVSGLQDLRTLLAAERMSTNRAPTATKPLERSPPRPSSQPAAVTYLHGYEYRYDAKTGQYLLAGTYAPLSSPGYAYLLVEDATQYHRPVYMELLQYPKEPDELPPWPVLYNDGEGRCPFAAPSTRRHTTTSPNVNRSLRVVLDELDWSTSRPPFRGRGSMSSYLSVEILDPTSAAAPPASMAIPGGMVAPYSTRSPTPVADEAGGTLAPPSGLSTGMTTIADLSVSQLSLPTPPRKGMTRSRSGNQIYSTSGTYIGSDQSKARLDPHLDPRLAALSKRPQVALCTHVPTTPLRAMMAQRAAGPHPPPAPRKRARDKKPGYCENCRTKFDGLEEHVGSRRHVRFAQNDENFASLDVLLASVVREPRMRPPCRSFPASVAVEL